MVTPSSHDFNYNNKSAQTMYDDHIKKKIGFAMCSLNEVKKNIIKNTAVDNIVFIK